MVLDHGILCHDVITKMIMDTVGAKSKRKSNSVVWVCGKENLNGLQVSLGLVGLTPTGQNNIFA